MVPAGNNSEIVEKLRQSSKTGQSLFALIDLANIPSDAGKLYRGFEQSDAACIFGDLSSSALLASPWLVPLPASREGDKALEVSVELATRSSAVTWLASELAPRSLVQRLRVRTEAQLPDHYDVLLRHFDPRVLPVLHRVLEPDQRQAFFALGQSWLFVDRQSCLGEITLVAAPQLDPFESPLELSDDQAVALLDAAEIDAVMPELIQEQPDQFLAIGDGPARYRFTEQCLRRARYWKLEHFPQKVVLCTLALRLGSAFDEQPAWQQALSRVAESGMRLSEAIAQATRASSPSGKDMHET